MLRGVTSRGDVDMFLDDRADRISDLEHDLDQMLTAVRYAVDYLPEVGQNIKVRAKLEMSLTDLLTTATAPPNKEEEDE